MMEYFMHIYNLVCNRRMGECVNNGYTCAYYYNLGLINFIKYIHVHAHVYMYMYVLCASA